MYGFSTYAPVRFTYIGHIIVDTLAIFRVAEKAAFHCKTYPRILSHERERRMDFF